MTGPSPEVRHELEGLLEKDQSRLGDVYRLTQQGLDPTAIAAELGVPTSGFVSNYRITTRAMLDGQIPAAGSMQRSIASSVRAKLRADDLSADARAYLRELLERLGSERIPDRPRARPTESLRQQVDQELRRRTEALVERIHDSAGIDADDYFAVVTATFALDAITRMIMRQSTGRTTRDLVSVGRLDLSLEEAVAEWARDLPLGSDLVEAAQGRVAYWRSS